MRFVVTGVMLGSFVAAQCFVSFSFLLRYIS